MDTPRHEQIAWLIEAGGPAIRWRAATELAPDAAVDREVLAAELLASAPVQGWLGRLDGGTRFADLHGSRPTTYENVMGKLTQLGCRAGLAPLDRAVAPLDRALAPLDRALAPLDRAVAPYVAWLDETADEADVGFMPFYRVLVVAGLLRAGYADDVMVDAALRRLDTLHAFARRGDLDIYVDPTNYRDMPAVYRDKRPLVDPALHADGPLPLPSLHDLYALGSLPTTSLTAEVQEKIDAVVAMILSPEYQALEPGYGYARVGPPRPASGRYYSIGWSVHLPGYDGMDGLSRGEAKALVRRMMLMAPFGRARRSAWYRAGLEHLAGLNEGDRYRWSSAYLAGDQPGYWVEGAYMAMEEDRRRRDAMALESTFWMLCLTQYDVALSRDKGAATAIL